MNRKSKRLAQLTLQLLCAASFAGFAQAEDFNIPRGDLKAALDTYATQTGTQFIYESAALKGIQTQGVHGNLSADTALSRILTGTGFTMRKDATGAIGITRTTQSATDMPAMTLAQAAPARAAVETVTVTSSKLGGADVQSIPIAITALSQEQLTATQTAGGPDLVKQVPNLTFTKTNFTGYSIQIRGIGTQAISVTTDPAVAVAFNDVPFIRNHFFEQEFYDVGQVEVLRGPQGTLYGRNATAGVVNLTSAKPSDQFEAMASAEIGNYHQRRLEGMLNLPIVDDRLDIRLAGEWTKRQGYSFNALDNQRIDGRDLWSSRLTIGVKPVDDLQVYLVWEHFSENDDRMRTAKQLCHRMPIPAVFGGDPEPGAPFGGTDVFSGRFYGSQGCQMSSLYSPEAFEVPNGFSLPYYFGIGAAGLPITGRDPYVNTVQSQNLRVIETAFNPIYRVKNDIVELNADYALTPSLTLTSQTAFNNDFLWSMEDYNRFNTAPGIFAAYPGDSRFAPDGLTTCDPDGNNCLSGGTFCDPQIGCSDRLVAEDLSTEHAWQFSQEFRLASSFSGPLNFSIGGNILHYETEEDYYVFINSLTAYFAGALVNNPRNNAIWQPGVTDNSVCLHDNLVFPDPTGRHDPFACGYIDPNPVTHLDGNGHNYFRSENPYTLNSYAAFGEAYYNIFSDLKLTAGLRWTEDRKHFTDIPSEVLVDNWGYPAVGAINQQWDQFTGRAVANWTPKLDFTDQTLIYGSYSHGYKAGGANPPGAVLLNYNGAGEINTPIHPFVFKPEFVDAFELGSKNTLLDGALTFNANAFYYNYENYQISEIVDRTSINLNFDAHVKGAEIEATWEPTPGLRFNFAGGYEDARLAKGTKAVDLMDRTAGNPNWLVVKPFVTQASNCVLPYYVLAILGGGGLTSAACGQAYTGYLDPVTWQQYVANPPFNAHGDPIDPGTYPGFDPLAGTANDPYTGQNIFNGIDYGPAPNNGAGFDKDLSGNQLPNAPPFTVSAGAQYTIPLSSDWAGTLRADYYWQDYSWARVFNDNPYDRLRGYTNVNLTLILTSQSGWQVMLYDKNVFNTTDITGTFLNSDDSGLTTNVFLTDPKLIGVRVTKNW